MAQRRLKNLPLFFTFTKRKQHSITNTEIDFTTTSGRHGATFPHNRRSRTLEHCKRRTKPPHRFRSCASSYLEAVQSGSVIALLWQTKVSTRASVIQASNSKHYFRKAGHELFTEPMPLRGQQHSRDYGWGAFGATSSPPRSLWLFRTWFV